jgi:hypothetical protein
MFWSDHRFDRDPHICSRGLNNSSGAMVGEVLVLYVTVLVLAVCVCVMLAIVKRGIWDDRCYHPTYY